MQNPTATIFDILDIFFSSSTQISPLLNPHNWPESYLYLQMYHKEGQ